MYVTIANAAVSVLFNEPKLLKCTTWRTSARQSARFSALQRAEIAEMQQALDAMTELVSFSALQRAEIAEI